MGSRVAKVVHSIAERQAAAKKHFMCSTKRQFSSAKEAEQKGSRVYRCPHCRLWHRTQK
jgi:predicted SprT family Zn-dependent metalloprotease